MVKTIRCENCGAAFSSEEKVCPYCGAENVPVSVREQMDYLADLRQRKRELDTVVPQEKTKRLTGKVTRIGIWVGIALLIMIVLGSAFAVVRARNRRAYQKQAVETLERFYGSKDFAGMEQYLREHDELWSATYDKYNDLAEIYYYYRIGSEYLQEDLEWVGMQSDIGEKEAEILKYDLNYLFRALSLLEELRSNDYVYNEQAGAEYLESLVKTVLKDNCMLTDEEIKEGIERYTDFDTDYTDLGLIALGRIF